MTEKFQTVVVGAGVSGVAASIASARHGARTVLVESGVCAGGLGSAGLVPCFTPFSYKKKPLIEGLLKELHDRLCSHNASNNDGWPFIDAEWMKAVCDEMLLEAGVEVRYLTTLTGVKTEGRLVREIEVLDRAGHSTIGGDNFIDCTGDAALANAAGVPFTYGDKQGHTQGGSCCFVIANIHSDRLLPEDLAERCSASGVFYLTNTLRRYLAQWRKEGKLANSDDFEFHVAGGNLDLKHGIARINFGHFYGLGCCDPARISYMLMEGRRRIREFVECLRQNMPGMEDAVLVATPGLPDIRESRHIIGRTVLTGDTFWNGETHEDDIAIYDYWVDVHACSMKEAQTPVAPEFVQKLKQNSMDKAYGIPFSILLPRELDNLAVAGRCVSATQEMLGALRVMPAAISTGQAAGTAAALHTPLSEVNIAQLRNTLQNDGVLLQCP